MSRRKRLLLLLFTVLNALQLKDLSSLSLDFLIFILSQLVALPLDPPLTLFSSCLQRALGLKVCARVEPHHNYLSTESLTTRNRFFQFQSQGSQCDQISSKTLIFTCVHLCSNTHVLGCSVCPVCIWTDVCTCLKMCV